MLRVALLLLLLIFATRFVVRLLSGVVEGIQGPRASGRTSTGAVQMVRDPVCGTFVVPGRAIALPGRDGLVHFCSATCRDRYRARTA